MKKRGFFAYFELEPILGIVRREYKKYFRNKSQIISSSLMPTIFMLFMRPAFGEWIGNMSLTSNYMGAGVIIMVVIMSGIMMSGIPILFDKMMGFIDIYAVAPVKRRNITLGFIIGCCIKVTFQCTIVILIGILSGLLNPDLGVYPYDFGWFKAGNPFLGVLSIIASTFMMYIMIFISAAVYACIGLSIAAKTDLTNAYLWFTLISIPLVYISGALIPVEYMLFIGLFNPTTYFADAIRIWLGGYTGNYGTGNLLVEILGLPCPKHSAQALFLGFGFDLLIIGIFGIFMFVIAFKVFGKSLTESTSGITGMFHKKVMEAQKKMFKKLDPEERKFMEYISSKIDMVDLMSKVQEDPTKLLPIFETVSYTHLTLPTN